MLNYYDMEFKDRLKQARIESGLTQVQLAEKVGLTQAAIQSLESGRVKSTTYIIPISKEVKKHPNWLLYGEEGEADFLVHTNNIEYIMTIPVLTDEEILELLKTGRLKDIHAYTRKVPFMRNQIKLENEEKLISYEMTGDAMISPSDRNGSLYPGQTLIIKVGQKPKSGNKVLAAIASNDIKIREYNVDGAEAWLKSLNPEFPRIQVTNNVHILGVVIGKMAIEIMNE